MRPIIAFAMLGSVLVTTACATTAPRGIDPDAATFSEENTLSPAKPALVESLPETVESFEFRGFKPFEDGSGGYSVRYANERKRRVADLYIYPVAKENLNLEHNQLVMGSTRATLMAISEATRQGHYSNFSVINAATRARGVRTVARVKATYLRQNLASYTLVYQTEYSGTLLKIRISMPDNEFNRSSREWDVFAETLFDKAITELESTELQTKDSV